MMGTNHIDGYARAMLDVAAAGGDTDRLSDELFRVALAFGGSADSLTFMGFYSSDALAEWLG